MIRSGICFKMGEGRGKGNRRVGSYEMTIYYYSVHFYIGLNFSIVNFLTVKDLPKRINFRKLHRKTAHEQWGYFNVLYLIHHGILNHNPNYK